MKLFSVHLWNLDYSEERNILIVANSETEAEDKALNKDYLDCAEAEEVNEIEGYRVKFEKIEY